MLVGGSVRSKCYQGPKLMVKQGYVCGTLNREDGRLQSQNTSPLFYNKVKHNLSFKHIKCICLNVKHVPC